MKIKAGDTVDITKGTKITFFSGSILAENPFQTEKMEYSCRARVLSAHKEKLFVEPVGEGYGFNVSRKDVKLTSTEHIGKGRVLK